jgi:hypothetical protein
VQRNSRPNTRRQQPRAQLRAAGEDAADFELTGRIRLKDLPDNVSRLPAAWPSLHSPVVPTSVPSASMRAGPTKNAGDWRCQTPTRTSLTASVSSSMSSGWNRRQKSPEVVGSGIIWAKSHIERRDQSNVVRELVYGADAATRNGVIALCDLVVNRANAELGSTIARLLPTFRRCETCGDLCYCRCEPSPDVLFHLKSLPRVRGSAGSNLPNAALSI